jgi:hypothetical protein
LAVGRTGLPAQEIAAVLNVKRGYLHARLPMRLCDVTSHEARPEFFAASELFADQDEQAFKKLSAI